MTTRRPNLTPPKLTREQLRQVRSLIEDSGYTRSEAIAMVLAGMGES